MKKQVQKNDPRELRLNRFIANSGICTRREADKLIAAGEIKVNGEVVTEMGRKVRIGKDKVEYQGKRLGGDTLRYVLINKPKGYGGKGSKRDKTLFSLLNERFSERLIALDELMEKELGLVVLTNDGRLAEGKGVSQKNGGSLYHAVLNKPITEKHLEALRRGVTTGAGTVKAIEVVVTAKGNGDEIGIRPDSDESGVVSAMLESIGYKVLKNDRVMYLGLTKKDLPRGRWRPLTDREVSFILMAIN